MPNQDWEKKFDKRWKRIEASMTGHISGRKIWSVSDDEDSYAFVDESLRRFIRSTINAEVHKAVKDTVYAMRYEIDIQPAVCPYCEYKFDCRFCEASRSWCKALNEKADALILKSTPV